MCLSQGTFPDNYKLVRQNLQRSHVCFFYSVHQINQSHKDIESNQIISYL